MNSGGTGRSAGVTDADLIRCTVYSGTGEDDVYNRGRLLERIEDAARGCELGLFRHVLIKDREIRAPWLREPLFRAIAATVSPWRVLGWKRMLAVGAHVGASDELRTVFSWTGTDLDIEFCIHAGMHPGSMRGLFEAVWQLQCFSGGDCASERDTEESSDFDEDGAQFAWDSSDEFYDV